MLLNKTVEDRTNKNLGFDTISQIAKTYARISVRINDFIKLKNELLKY